MRPWADGDSAHARIVNSFLITIAIASECKDAQYEYSYSKKNKMKVPVPRGRFIAALTIAVAGITLSSCATTQTGSSRATTTAPSRHATYVKAIAELRNYLQAWQRHGPVVAARGYISADQQPTGPGYVHLSSGRVINYQPSAWTSSHRFTVLVKMDLHFTGSPAAWNVGNNDRFVTFTWSSTVGRYLMDFNTGP